MYYRTDHAGEKCAVILPAVIEKSIVAHQNALLVVRDFGSTEWQTVNRTFSFDSAKECGNEYVRKYAHDLANSLLHWSRSRNDDFGIER